MSFVCDLSSLIGDALDSALNAIGIDLQGLIDDLLAKIGISFPSFDLPSLGNLDVFPKLENPITDARDQVISQIQRLTAALNLG